MVKLLDNSRTSLFNYFYMFCILMYAGQATVFTRHLGDITSVGNAFALFITLIFIFKNKIKFNRYFFYSISVFIFYAAATSLNNGLVNPTWILSWLIKLTIAYCICHGLGKRMFVLVESVLCPLCAISLICWIIHILNPELIKSIVKTFEFSRPYAEEGNVVANMLFYTITVGDPDDFMFFVRNAGFAWEPGAFASIICFGIFCNLLRTNFRFYRNFTLWLFLLTLLSAQSTTGGITLILMAGIWMVANRKYCWGIILIPAALGLLSLPFIGGKFSEEIRTLDAMDYTNTYVDGGNFNRSYSLVLDFQEFLRHPILGLGGWTKGTWYVQQGYEFNTVSGIGELLSQYGAIITLLFIYMLVKSCKYIKDVTGSSSAYVLIGAMLGMMYSYSLWQHPFFIAFWMFGVYAVDLNEIGKYRRNQSHMIEYQSPTSII